MDKITKLENLDQVILVDDEEIFLDAWKMQLETDEVPTIAFGQLADFEAYLAENQEKDFSKSLLILDRFFDEEGLDALEDRLPERFRKANFSGLVVLCSNLQSIEPEFEASVDGIIGKLPEEWSSIKHTIKSQLLED